MQGLVFDIRHCTIHDGPGIRTTVFLKGCPLCCQWCHNPESISGKTQEIVKQKQVGSHCFKETATIGSYISGMELLDILKKDTVFYEESGGGVTFSGGEPLMQAKFLLRMLQLCKKQHIHTVLDTSGYGESDLFIQVVENTDLVLFDIKMLDDQLHQNYTGVSNKVILENFNHLISKGVKTIVRYPLIPGINNSDEQLAELKTFLKGKVHELHILPYHAIASYKYEQFGMEYTFGDIKEPEEKYLEIVKNEFILDGYKVKIGG